MLSFRKILNVVSCCILLVSLISVSGSTSISSNYESQQTELIRIIPTLENVSVAQYKSPIKSLKTLAHNQFIVFNFKVLLNIHYFDFSITLRSQKSTTIQCLKFKLLEQNLIARNNTSYYKIAS